MLLNLKKMLKNLKESLALHRKAKEIFKEYKKEIIEIVVFGSFVKGKILPKDIDVCIIFREKINEEINRKIKENLSKELSIHVSSLLIDNFFLKPHSLAKTLLKEGVSLINEKSLSENLGFSQCVLYSYSLRDKKPNEKTKIVYVLKGRSKEQGFVVSSKGEWVADNCFIVPISVDNEIIKIFSKWQVKFERKNILLG